MNIELINRLWDKTKVVNKCWIWIGAKSGYGNKENPYYGHVRYNGTDWHVHRWSLCIYLKIKYNDYSWEACHICSETLCWNPLHLYQGTRYSNRIDTIINGNDYNKNKTHCPKGHPYTKQNTMIYNNRRMCRICGRENTRRYRLEKRRG
jgi:hypothetical protein